MLERAAGGDREAFARLYDDQVEGVFRYLLAWTGDRSAARDMTARVFKGAMAWLPVTAGGEGEAGAWLVAMARDAVPQARGSGRIPGPGDGQAAAGDVVGAGALLAATHGWPTPWPWPHRCGRHPRVRGRPRRQLRARPAPGAGGRCARVGGRRRHPGPSRSGRCPRRCRERPALGRASGGVHPARASRRPWMATGVAVAGIVVVLALQALGDPVPLPTYGGLPCPAPTTAGAGAAAGGTLGTPLSTVRPATTTTTLPTTTT